MLGFFIGLFVGAFIGMTAMCLCTRQGKQTNMKTAQIRTKKFIEFDDTIPKKFVVSLLVERSVRKCRQ